MRISILEVLAMDGGRVLSPSDLSAELQMPLSNINYHVTELVKAAMVEESSTRQVRGATEHFYRMVQQASTAQRRRTTNAGRAAHRSRRHRGRTRAGSS